MTVDQFKSYLKSNIDSLLQEFTTTSDRWTQLALNGLYRSEDLEIRNSEREFNLLLSITTLSGAFLAIVVPLIKDSISPLLILIISLSIGNLIFGVLALILCIKLDKKWIASDGEWYYAKFTTFQNKTIEIGAKLREYKNNPDDRLSEEIYEKYKVYMGLRDNLGKEADLRKIKKDTDKLNIWQEALEKIFWCTTILSLVFLAYWIFGQIFSDQQVKYNNYYMHQPMCNFNNRSR